MLAAFVHADLLDNPLAAIELIERSGDYRRAAELAEGWMQEPGLTCDCGGGPATATEPSRLLGSRGAFADAVTRLERSTGRPPRAAPEWVATSGTPATTSGRSRRPGR